MNPEYIKLAKIAFNTVLATMQEGEQTHPEQEWQTVSEKTHIAHIYEHLFDYTAPDRSEDHIAHALTRLVMIKAKQK